MVGQRYIITGGGGFVGSAIARKLIERGDEVISIARGDYPELRSIGVKTERVDLGSPIDSWKGLFEGVTGVFHTAAKVQLWGPYQEFFLANVVGTRNVVECCRFAKVRALVFTSSPSVIADGTQLRGVDEGYPYPRTHHAHYPATKAQSEREVLAADSTGDLRTVALRPHLIWGKNDTNLIPTILERAKSGKLIQVGDGKNTVDLTYIDDCVQAHIKVMEALLQNPEAVGGKAYFISQGDPVSLWKWIADVLERHGVGPVKKSLPYPVAYSIACIAEGVAKLKGMLGFQSEPLLTRLLVSEMATDHYFSIARAKRDFGFEPTYSIAEAMDEAFGPALEKKAA